MRAPPSPLACALLGAAAACAACAAAALAWSRWSSLARGGGPGGAGAGGCARGASFGALVGGTPLVRLPAVSAAAGCEVWAKLELRNAGGSNKCRVVAALVDAAEARGELVRGARGTLVEGSSGSTALSLAALAAARGYACTVALPADASADKFAALARAGATVLVAPAGAGATHADHYVALAARAAAALRAAGERALFVDQFFAPGNAAAHAAATGPELWAQTRADGLGLAAFVCAAGTGGTFAGVGAALRARDAAVRLVLADPPGSVLAARVAAGVAFAPSQAERGLRRARDDTLVEGVGADRLTPTLARAAALADAAAVVGDDETVATARFLARREGFFVGSSSALNVAAAVKVGRALRAAGAPASARVVTLICDGGERHVARFWNDAAIAARGLAGAARAGEEDAGGMAFVR